MPKSLAEQKNSFLPFFLDKAIETQAQKIEQLKHKKGLMQGLFPKIKG